MDEASFAAIHYHKATPDITSELFKKYQQAFSRLMLSMAVHHGNIIRIASYHGILPITEECNVASQLAYWSELIEAAPDSAKEVMRTQPEQAVAALDSDGVAIFLDGYRHICKDHPEYADVLKECETAPYVISSGDQLISAYQEARNALRESVVANLCKLGYIPTTEEINGIGDTLPKLTYADITKPDKPRKHPFDGLFNE